ncbi:potassium channel family protein, partial [Clostridium paraputrificum]|uniref:potassium channel family protein n=2 Tax=Clostridiaceae TaxID=31979 RepID=UPI00232D16D7
KGAFSSNPNNFDLFYYTIVTFTTIGFGDISPVSNLAKFMAIVISITSIICLTIFLGSIFSLRERKE